MKHLTAILSVAVVVGLSGFVPAVSAVDAASEGLYHCVDVSASDKCKHNGGMVEVSYENERYNIYVCVSTPGGSSPLCDLDSGPAEGIVDAVIAPTP